MTPNTNARISRYASFSLGLIALAGIAAAQDQTPRPWRSVDDPPPASANEQSPQPNYQPNLPGQPNLNAQPDYAQANQSQAPDAGQPQPYPAQGNYPAPPAGYPQQSYPQQSYPQQAYPQQQGNYPQGPNPYPQGANNYPQGNYPSPAPVNVPAQLTIKAGTYITARVNQWLSSDRNQQGDTFSAVLDQPIVVDGFVVAQRGQTVTGRVSEAQKAGRVEGTSRLGLQLTDLTIVDGQQLPVQSQMISRSGPTSIGRDAAAIGTTTALGAIIGAGADWGRGAAIGAGAGAAAGIIGVLLTRGHPTEVYPESVLTFRIDQPVTIATDHAPQAFRYADTQQDYGRGQIFSSRPPVSGPPAYAPAYAPAYPPPAYAYGYPYPYYGGFGLYIGPGYGYYYGHGYYGHGYYGGYHRH
jgi:hypothetical protein